MPSEYVDFEVIISPLAESRYHVAASGPGGQARGVLTLPTDEPQFRALLERLERLETDHAALVAMGDALFGRLFQDTIEHILVASQALLGPDQSLRLKLNVDAALPEVIRLPWELLRDQRGPLALLDAPIVRFLPLPVRAPTLPVDPPLRVLLSAAQTPPPAGVERELREVQSALEALGDRVQIVVEPHLTARRLQQHLRAGFHIWHFVGHGSVSGDGAGQIVFEDEAGDSAPLTAPELQIYLNRSGVRLIVLNACQGARLSTDPFHSMAPALIRAQVPAVVAMQFSVPEETARAFAGEFYRTLAEGWPIDACVTEARKAVMAICGLGRADWAIPVVYTRAPDGQLFPRTAVPAP
ncbi:MAG TPA: CHAT domain-containing protein, partial [Roseiflexaceae bacterium]|nr:CHAT domain-containing protein [Roseiflexaceae bacterium]